MLGRWASGMRWSGASTLAAALFVVGPASAQLPCVGDCNGDGEVTIDELTREVGIILQITPLEQCTALDANDDGSTAINELIQGVSNALNGCPAAAPTTAGIVFNGEANRLHAYLATDGFPSQVVIPSHADDPGGRDINAQICFTRGPQGQLRFIAGEDTNQGQGHEGAGWGLFELTGTTVGEFQWTQLNHLQPHYQATEDGAENYGCGFLSDGRLVTTDVGNQASGQGNGQLIIWFPPLDGDNARFCKLDISIGTAQQIAIDDQDRIYVGSARDNGQGDRQGIYRYTGPFPTSDTGGDCGRVDPSGDPLVNEGLIAKELFIPGDSHAQTPGGIVFAPGGGFYVASVLNGVIAQYDADGRFVRRVLNPPNPGPGASTGNPLGLGIASDGTLYYADIGLVIGPGGIGPGRRTGSVRRLRFVDDEPQTPETMASGLDFPDGIGILELPTPTESPDPAAERPRNPTATPPPRL